LKIGLRLTSREVFRGLTSLEGEVTAGQFVELIERMITVDRKLLPDDFPEAGAG
jgi:hypothetical protein